MSEPKKGTTVICTKMLWLTWIFFGKHRFGGRIVKSSGSGLDEEDLLQAALMGLMRPRKTMIEVQCKDSTPMLHIILGEIRRK